MTPSIQKALESFDEKFKKYLNVNDWGLSSAEMDFKDFLTTALEEVAKEAYRDGCETTLKQTDPDHKACFNEVEKAKLVWSDIGYRNGLESAREKIIEADKQIGDCYPFLTTENDTDKEQIDKYNKMVYFFFHKTMENTIANIDSLIKNL